MSTPFESLIIEIVGGSISILGSMLVAKLYIDNQNKREKEKEIHTFITNEYFSNGLFLISNAISEYGLSTVYALNDLRIWSVRCIKYMSRNYSFLKENIDSISNRKIIKDLTNRNFGLTSQAFPRIQIFGMPFYNSIKRTLQLYGNLLIDWLSIETIQRELSSSPLEKFEEGLESANKIVQMTEIFLEQKIEQLKDYIWKKEYTTYSQFVKITNEEQYEVFLFQLKQYLWYLKEWMDGLKSPDSKKRAISSFTLSFWLTEQGVINPFELENLKSYMELKKEAIKLQKEIEQLATTRFQEKSLEEFKRRVPNFI